MKFEQSMEMFVRIATLCALLFLTSKLHAQTEEDNVLAQCRAQSEDIDRIHSCLDTYLDVMDSNIEAITAFLDDLLSGDSRQGLLLSQQAFENYRRQNCLWYLNFSSPRSAAEQIAKQCLVDMSSQRLQELRNLVSTENESIQTVQGFYVYGTERNTFQPCGSDERYWIEGAPEAVGLIQQTYLSIATGERQLLHASLVGTIDRQLQVPSGHNGAFELDNLIALRVPTDSDCQVPGFQGNLNVAQSEAFLPEQQTNVVQDAGIQNEEPEQQLTAYFGGWLADCIELAQQKSCVLDVAITPAGVDLQDTQASVLPKLSLYRRSAQSTDMELFFPKREIESPVLIRWVIDDRKFGDLFESEIRVDQLGARQLIAENPLLTDELLPAMIEGIQLNIDVLTSVDDESGERFSGTLVGFTKALAFADDFIGE